MALADKNPTSSKLGFLLINVHMPTPCHAHGMGMTDGVIITDPQAALPSLVIRLVQVTQRPKDSKIIF